jgi:hypothetical protein
MVAPAEPARSTGLPLGSCEKCVPAWVLTSNAGVPWSNERVKVSPAATADTIGGVVLVLVSGPGQDAEAAPPEMHAKGEGLGAGVGVACELPPPPEEPHAASNIAIATIAPIFVPTTGAGLRSAPVALKGFTWWVREAVVAAPA